MKWHAGLFKDKVRVIGAKFKKTPKLLTLIREDSKEYREMLNALRYCVRFEHDDRRLYDCPGDALEALDIRMINSVKNAERHLVDAKKNARIVAEFINAQV
jgi:hypothetical protein